MSEIHGRLIHGEERRLRHLEAEFLAFIRSPFTANLLAYAALWATQKERTATQDTNDVRAMDRALGQAEAIRALPALINEAYVYYMDRQEAEADAERTVAEVTSEALASEPEQREAGETGGAAEGPPRANRAWFESHPSAWNLDPRGSSVPVVRGTRDLGEAGGGI